MSERGFISRCSGGLNVGDFQIHTLPRLRWGFDFERNAFGGLYLWTLRCGPVCISRFNPRWTLP